MNYAAYGLDTVKKETDEPTKGQGYCCWCYRTVDSGFSMCFQHFCICLDCASRAQDQKLLAEAWIAPQDKYDQCFKCKNKGVELFVNPSKNIGICEECILWAKDVLINKEKYYNNMVLDILKSCTVEGMMVKLPAGQLERKVYEEVKKKLELIGGKWKGGKTQGFVFEEDPTQLLNEIANGDERNLKQEYQFFGTPPDIANQMISYLPPVPANAKVLEPSAGNGALIKAFKTLYPAIVVDCFELMDLNRKRLQNIAGVNILYPNDFVFAVENDPEDRPDFKGHYDIVIANPPFAKNQDIDHIRKMYECLKPGGTIITLASTSWTFGSQKKQVEFKQWLESMDVFPLTLPQKSFASSGTMVTPVLLQIKKPIEDIQEGDEQLSGAGGSMSTKTEDKEPTPPDNISLEERSQLLAKLSEYRITSLDDGEISRATGDTVAPFRNFMAVKQLVADGLTIEQIYAEFPLKEEREPIQPNAPAISAQQAFEQFHPTFLKLKQDFPSASGEDWWRSRWADWVNIKAGDPEWERKKSLELIWPTVWHDFHAEFCKRPTPNQRHCRVCGCTEEDCRQCIEKTGQPCHWVEADLCSACVEVKPEKPAKPSRRVKAAPAPAEDLAAPEVILDQMIETHKAAEEHLNELKQMLSPTNDKDMIFFQTMYEHIDGVDVTMTIKRKNGKITLSVLPQAITKIAPVMITGTPEELDAEFFNVIAAPLNTSKGVKVEIEQFNNSLKAAKDDAEKKAKEKPSNSSSKKPESKKQVKKGEKKADKTVAKEKIQEPDLFG
jgi:PRTRC genetic system protein E